MRQRPHLCTRTQHAWLHLVPGLAAHRLCRRPYRQGSPALGDERKQLSFKSECTSWIGDSIGDMDRKGSWPRRGWAHVPNGQALLPSIADASSFRRTVAPDATSVRGQSWFGNGIHHKTGCEAGKADHHSRLLVVQEVLWSGERLRQPAVALVATEFLARSGTVPAEAMRCNARMGLCLMGRSQRGTSGLL
jgi:hypothetical protein